MKFEIRKIEDYDYPFLREMIYEALFLPEGEKPFPASIVDRPEIAKYIDHWNHENDFGFIIRNGNNPAGAVWARLFNESNKGYGYIDAKTPELSMAVKKDYRNLGLGAKLIEQFIIAATERGFLAISLSVDKRNRAFYFYKRMGFEIVNELETAYIMKKELK